MKSLYRPDSHGEAQSGPESALGSLLVQAVIPSLASAHDLSTEHQTTWVTGALGENRPNPAASKLALLALEGRLEPCMAFVQAQRASGMSLIELFLGVLQPAARQLGQGWEEDSCRFTDVTVGLWQLQQVFMRLVPEVHQAPMGRERRGRPGIFLTAMPGAHHRFGVQMLGAVFFAAGWSVTVSEATDEQGQVLDATRSNPNILGLSLSCERDLLQAPKHIQSLRLACEHTQPFVMIGGPAVHLFPDQVQALQADALCGDAPDALQQATQLLALGLARG